MSPPSKERGSGSFVYFGSLGVDDSNGVDGVSEGSFGERWRMSVGDVGS